MGEEIKRVKLFDEQQICDDALSMIATHYENELAEAVGIISNIRKALFKPATLRSIDAHNVRRDCMSTIMVAYLIYKSTSAKVSRRMIANMMGFNYKALGRKFKIISECMPFDARVCHPDKRVWVRGSQSIRIDIWNIANDCITRVGDRMEPLQRAYARYMLSKIVSDMWRDIIDLFPMQEIAWAAAYLVIPASVNVRLTSFPSALLCLYTLARRHLEWAHPSKAAQFSVC